MSTTDKQFPNAPHSSSSPCGKQICIQSPNDESPTTISTVTPSHFRTALSTMDDVNFSRARVLRVATYNPPAAHAAAAFANLSRTDQLRALRGADERNFRDYDVLPFTSAANLEAAKLMARAREGVVVGATSEEMKRDFKKMHIKWEDQRSDRPRRTCVTQLVSARESETEIETQSSEEDDSEESMKMWEMK